MRIVRQIFRPKAAGRTCHPQHRHPPCRRACAPGTRPQLRPQPLQSLPRGPTGFAPVHDAEGNCVPSLYAADALEAGIFETIFHDIPVTARRKTVPRTLVQSRAHGRLQVRRDLQMASLRGPDLRRWRVSRTSLITMSPSLYRDTARWAEAIQHRFPDVDGLLWTSNQCDPDGLPVFRGPGGRGGFANRASSRGTGRRDVFGRRAPGGSEKRDQYHGLAAGWLVSTWYSMGRRWIAPLHRWASTVFHRCCGKQPG